MLQLGEARAVDGRSHEGARRADHIGALDGGVIVQHRAPRARMARRHTKVDQRLPFSFGVPGSDGISTELQLERRSDTVARQKSVIDRVLTVRVEIDEPGRDDESFDVYRVARRGDARGHGGYAPPSDSYGANRVETRFRIEHPAADEHDVDRRGALGHRVRYRECKLANRQQDERA